MIEITFTAPRRHDGVVEWDTVAVLHIDGKHLEVEGDRTSPRSVTSNCSTRTRGRP
jgi:hypothetical protein